MSIPFWIVSRVQGGRKREGLSNLFQVGWFLWRRLEAAPDGEESNAQCDACDDKILMVTA